MNTVFEHVPTDADVHDFRQFRAEHRSEDKFIKSFVIPATMLKFMIVSLSLIALVTSLSLPMPPTPPPIKITCAHVRCLSNTTCILNHKDEPKCIPNSTVLLLKYPNYSILSALSNGAANPCLNEYTCPHRQTECHPSPKMCFTTPCPQHECRPIVPCSEDKVYCSRILKIQ